MRIHHDTLVMLGQLSRARAAVVIVFDGEGNPKIDTWAAKHSDRRAVRHLVEELRFVFERGLLRPPFPTPLDE